MGLRSVETEHTCVVCGKRFKSRYDRANVCRLPDGTVNPECDRIRRRAYNQKHYNLRKGLGLCKPVKGWAEMCPAKTHLTAKDLVGGNFHRAMRLLESGRYDYQPSPTWIEPMSGDAA